MRKYLKWGIIGFELLLIASLVGGIKQSRETKARVDQLVEERKKLQTEREELLKRLEYVQGPEYLEKVARDELNLARPGETVIIVPEDQRISESASQQVSEREKANWEKWWEVLSGKM